MEKTDKIKSFRSGKGPVKVGLYMEYLKPEYHIEAGYDEGHQSENESWEPFYFVNIYHRRPETPEEVQARADKIRKELVWKVVHRLRESSPGDMFYQKTFKGKELQDVRLLKLESWNERTREVRFEIPNTKYDASHLNTTIELMQNCEYEPNPGVKMRSFIQKIP